MKQLVIDKKLNMWNNIIEKANQDLEGNKKQFWSFVGRRTKCKNKTISSMKSEAGISVLSTKGRQASNLAAALSAFRNKCGR